MKLTPVFPVGLALRGGLEDVHLEARRFQFLPHDVEVAERIGAGEVASRRKSRTAGSGGGSRGVIGRLCWVSLISVTVLSAMAAATAWCCSLPTRPVRRRPGTRSSRAVRCRPSDAFSARMRSSASCRRCSVMIPLVAVEHVLEVLVGVAEEQEHVAAGGDGGRYQVPAFHGLGQADHLRGVGQDEAVEAQFVAEQVLQQFGGQGGRQDLGVGDAGAVLPGQFRGADVADHDGLHAVVDQFAVHLAVGLVPLVEPAGCCRT